MDEISSVRSLLTPLKRIPNPKGDLLHGMKESDPGYAGFGEIYITTVSHGETKGWKLHPRMTMNLIVPQGTVQFSLHDEHAATTVHVELGHENYQRLTVPPGVWMAFRGVGTAINMVINVASIEHDPAEAITAPLERFPLESQS